MKNQKYHYVVQLESGLYWAGLNTFTDQLRKAQLYNSIPKAKEAVESAIKRNRKYIDSTLYRIIKVEINILELGDWLDAE